MTTRTRRADRAAARYGDVTTAELIRRRTIGAVTGARDALARLLPEIRAGRVAPNQLAALGAVCDALQITATAVLAGLDVDKEKGSDHDVD